MKEEIKKTNDVETTEDVSFRDMMLSDQVLAGLIKCNFEKPSPIQLRAIPIGRCGLGIFIEFLAIFEFDSWIFSIFPSQWLFNVVGSIIIVLNLIFSIQQT